MDVDENVAIQQLERNLIIDNSKFIGDADLRRVEGLKFTWFAQKKIGKIYVSHWLVQMSMIMTNKWNFFFIKSWKLSVMCMNLKSLQALTCVWMKSITWFSLKTSKSLQRPLIRSLFCYSRAPNLSEFSMPFEFYKVIKRGMLRVSEKKHCFHHNISGTQW